MSATAQPAIVPASANPVGSKRRHLLRELNFFGLDHLDPVFLAALADERPLLLIGAHGTGKSELLNRIASSLQLEHRHFNASLISFDDLLGYPVPNAANDGLTYLRTPGDLWDAESVFLDEISRCRPETQNKLFSVIHERRIQGLPLERLRYRWAAMNPPAPDDGDVEDLSDIYHGAVPLDPALADRFPYVVVVPTLLDLSAQERGLLIRRGGRSAEGGHIPELIAETRETLESLGEGLRDWTAGWSDGVALALRDAGWMISGRRAVSLVASALAIHAASLVLGGSNDLDDLHDHAYLALKWGLPQRALGRTIDEAKLRAVHRSALLHAGEPPDSSWAAIRTEADSVRRIAIAIEAGDVGMDVMSSLVQDALAAQPPAERHALACTLMPVFAWRDLLDAPTCEQIAELASPILQFASGGEQAVQVHRSRAGVWDEVMAEITRLEKAGYPLLSDVSNVLMALFAADAESFEPERLARRYCSWHRMFTHLQESEAA